MNILTDLDGESKREASRRMCASHVVQQLVSRSLFLRQSPQLVNSGATRKDPVKMGRPGSYAQRFSFSKFGVSLFGNV